MAKHIDDVGSIALKTTHGEHLSKFKQKLLQEVGYDKIQLITISRPSAYGEYEPYKFVSDENEFEKCVISM